MTLQQLSYQYQEQARVLHGLWICAGLRPNARVGRVRSICASASGTWSRCTGRPASWRSSPPATMTGGITKMRTTPSEAFDPVDIASLCLWRQEESGDNRERIRRLLSNLPLAVQQELTPRQREILRLHFTGGMSVTAIAEKLGVNKSTVSRSLARSIERLYKSLRYSL